MGGSGIRILSSSAESISLSAREDNIRIPKRAMECYVYFIDTDEIPI